MELTEEQIKEWEDTLEIPGYTIIEEKMMCDTIDDGDGNPMRVIIQDNTTLKYYALTYDYWVGSNDKDGISELTEVFPKTKTITIYE